MPNAVNPLIFYGSDAQGKPLYHSFLAEPKWRFGRLIFDGCHTSNEIRGNSVDPFTVGMVMPFFSVIGLVSST